MTRDEEAQPLLPEASGLTFSQVQSEEQAWIDKRESQRICSKAGTPPREKFFSGGGMRAAAFQAGVLWRLAEEGRLKDMEYLAAVSGGAYIASAWTSHVLDAGVPAPMKEDLSGPEDVDKWYRGTVAKTIARMQRNAGDFVRDPFLGKLFQGPGDGSSLLPRIFDLPLLLGALALALAISVGEIIIVYLVPLKELVAFAFGPALRAAYCAPQGVSHLQVLWTFSCFPLMVAAGVLSFLVTCVTWLMKRLQRTAYFFSRTETWQLLFVRSLHGFAKRFTIGVVAAAFLVGSLPALQAWTFGADPTTSASHCYQYVRGQQLETAAAVLNGGCSDWTYGAMWYDRELTHDSRFQHPPLEDIVAFAPGHSVSMWASNSSLTQKDSPEASSKSMARHRSILNGIVDLFLTLFIFAILITPLTGNLRSFLAGVITPLLLVLCLLIVLCIFQYRIYAPLTGQAFAVSWMPSSPAFWRSLTIWSFVAGIVLLPFHDKLRSFWHFYYARSLRQNFFAAGRDGKDFPLRDIISNPFCPFLLLTGTANDFSKLSAVRYEDRDPPRSEIFFSPLYTGGVETGYVETPSDRTLSTCTALSGGGAVDCLALSMKDKMELRVVLELANLSWGNYISFVEKKLQGPGQKAAYDAINKMRSTMGSTNRSEVEGQVDAHYRIPQLLIIGVWQVLMTIGWRLATTSTGSACRYAPDVFFMAIFVWLVIVFFSFFAYHPNLQCLLLSPMIRQLHQVTRFRFQGERPPGVLYVTDGGVEDCTGLIQLMQRRCKKILLVLAAADPNDELAVLKEAMHVAVDKLKLGSFYDPTDAHRDVKILLEKFKDSTRKDEPFLHLGIRYGWDTSYEWESPRSSRQVYGDLYIIKNRLPQSMSEQTVRPLISESEVVGEPVAKSTKAVGAKSVDDKQEDLAGMKETDLGGLGCCDCCHRRGANCGAKFPHLTAANYIWLSPTLFSSLCRLGHDLSGPVLTDKRTGIFKETAAPMV
eukprot:CAMPEP_0178412400 /NCGR_PEP_ID=MMETSP0689_2-20121128/21997_1 /TAXON_ID=160604 /ORGANISM="Amphidinium massartii, Strain CS-259" /LENGTH=984 /DNA_ID=CAMNT_0020033649 /DNA_START=36 /DNA_END=2991 /DNA_ORIENTATION=+